MRTSRVLRSSRIACLAGAALAWWGASVFAIEADHSLRGLTQEQVAQFEGKGIPDEEYPRLLELLGREDESMAIRALIKAQTPFPAAKLVSQLSSNRLAIRLGALDLLEDVAGETFGFDPWQEDPSAGGNAEALARWKAWLEKGAATKGAAPLTLDEEAFRTLAIEIMSGQRDRAERAMARLDGVGLSALQPIESFLASQPTLDAGPRASMKMAEYRLVLRELNPKQAPALARDLALGSSEAQTNAIAALGALGEKALPVITEFLGSPDTLVRESAVDALFKAAGAHAYPLATACLKDEKSESVIHAILRGFGENGSDAAAAKSILPFLDHPSENVVIAALEAMGKAVSSEHEAVARKMTDPRWRVRAAALAAAANDVSDLKDQIVARLGDSDLFVRVAAVEAIEKMNGSQTAGILMPVFKQKDDLKPAILKSFFEGNKTPSDEVWSALEKAPPEVILQCLDTLEGRDDHEGRRAVYAGRFATHSNRDVAAAALRILASHGLETGRLLEALTSGDSVKQDAVLDHLHLRGGYLGSTKSSAPVEAPSGSAPKNGLVDRLYDALAGKSASPKPAAVQSDGSEPARMRAVLDKFFREGSPRQKFCAAQVLMSQGDASAAKFLLESIDSFSGLDRRSIAGAMNAMSDWPKGPVYDLAVRLLRDSADDVREKAVETWLERKSVANIEGLLTELARQGSLLSPDDIYGWDLNRMMESGTMKSVVRNWAMPVLGDSSARDSVKVMAIVLLAKTKQLANAGVERLRTSESPWLRRAAYHALGASLSDTELKALLSDESAMVRVVIPFLGAPGAGGWVNWFDDEHHAAGDDDDEENSFSSNSFGAWAGGKPKGTKAAPGFLDALEKLSRDPSEIVRFEAQFALLRLGRSIDPAGLAGMVAAQPKESNADYRVGRYLEKNYRRLGKAYGVLLPFLHDRDSDQMAQIQGHFGIRGKALVTSIAALAQQTPTVLRPADFAVAAAGATNGPEAAAAVFRVLFFHKPGCRDCERVREMLNQHAREFPRMTIEELDINDQRQALVNEALSARFRLKDVLHQVTPTVFTQGGALVRDDITFSKLGDLLRTASTLPPAADWSRVEASETAAAHATITQRYASMSFGVVALAGLLDGVNPCAFATIIFLLSYLQVVKRTPAEILAVGGSFILAVFLTYFLVGRGLAQVLAKVSALRVAGTLLNYLLAAFALVVAVLSFRDARLAAKGRIGDMALQLPGGLKERIRSVVRSGARARRFVVAAFVIGIVISLLELACTGQVYLPTILYMLNFEESGATKHLVVYNVAFVVPLAIVFGLAWTGMRSEALIQFQQRRTALVKVLTGILFLALTVFLLFGHALMPKITGG